jgi:ankyrin repeat protein
MLSAHAAARSGDVDAIAAAVAATPECVHETDKLSRTALHLGAWAGHAGVVRRLLEAKANVHAGACDNMLAIHFAAQNGHEDVCKELLKAGGKVRRKPRTRSKAAAQNQRVRATGERRRLEEGEHGAAPRGE